MWTTILRQRRLSLLIGGCLGALLTAAYFYLQNDIHRNNLDPKIPFQIYKTPAAPDYADPKSWYLNPSLSGYYADPRKVDVFFVHATSFNGGRAWLGSIDSRSVTEEVTRIQLPNYAAPFAITGNVYAPKYRQASLYSQLTWREDALEARAFAYGDVERAFRQFLRTRRGGRGFVVVGVEQGGLLAERLLRDIVAPDPKYRSQLVAAYLMETMVPEDLFPERGPGLAPCQNRTQVGCVMAYVGIEQGRPDKALQVLQKSVYWQGARLEKLKSSQNALCVNPLAGGLTRDNVDARHALGATNATGLEWGIEPGLTARAVSAHCGLNGLLVVSRPPSPSFDDQGSWETQRKVNAYNLFYGDLEADIAARWHAFNAG